MAFREWVVVQELCLFVICQVGRLGKDSTLCTDAAGEGKRKRERKEEGGGTDGVLIDCWAGESPSLSEGLRRVLLAGSR
jgi:hypothetical protein